MATEDNCSLCGAIDTWRHALFTCPMSSSVWALAPEELVHHLMDRQEENPKDWLFALSEIMSRDTFAHMIVILWAIWRARRKAIYEDIFQSPHTIYGFITSYLQDISVITKREVQQRATNVNRPTQWQPPSASCVKINVLMPPPPGKRDMELWGQFAGAQKECFWGRRCWWLGTSRTHRFLKPLL